MTVRHYYTDAYRAEFTAAIVERGGGTRVYLDETAFTPPPAASRMTSDARRRRRGGRRR
jgi:hypothetical protein